jgi:hypothetical protein
MPTLSLNQKQCSSIQSPAICAILSKLHLNQHTSCAIVFGPSDYGGLDLPELYTSEGIGQFRFLLGHLRLHDKTAKLILIYISYIQLLVVSSTLFFNLPYTAYSHSTDGGWLVSVWNFLFTTGLQIQIKRALVTQPPRKADMAIMDFFISLNLKPKQLKILNRCRVYLQILFVSDICSADGLTILPNYKHGHRLDHRSSSLDWPHQPRPPASAWSLWRNSLAHLESKGKLITALGDWTSSTHQEWQQYVCPYHKYCSYPPLTDGMSTHSSPKPPADPHDRPRGPIFQPFHQTKLPPSRPLSSQQRLNLHDAPHPLI